MNATILRWMGTVTDSDAALFPFYLLPAVPVGSPENEVSVLYTCEHSEGFCWLQPAWKELNAANCNTRYKLGER